MWGEKMKAIKYFKAEPTEYARVTVNGKIKKKGKGISCVYMPFRTSIELVSVAAEDQGFVFKEVSKDNQVITMQGGFVYQVTQPELAMAKYNFSIDSVNKGYLTDDYMKLPQHLLQMVQTEAKKIAEAESLEKLIVMSEDISHAVGATLKGASALEELGISLDMLYFSAVRPTPEIAKALEADYRESLLQKADEAIFARWAMAVENERAIQENEMKTKVELEQKKQELVTLEGENILKKADYKAKAMEKEFAAHKGIDPATLAGHGFYQLGKNAKNIDSITITTELLASLMNLPIIKPRD